MGNNQIRGDCANITVLDFIRLHENLRNIRGFQFAFRGISSNVDNYVKNTRTIGRMRTKIQFILLSLNSLQLWMDWKELN